MKKVLLVFAVVFFTANLAFGQTTYKGKITSKKGNDPIALVVVKAIDTQGKTVAHTQTDGKGKFEITLPAGCNQIEVTKKGYSSRTLTVGKKKKLKIKMLKQ